MTRRAAVLAVLVLLASAAAWLRRPLPDLFSLSRRGSLPDANVTLVVTDDGYVTCATGRKPRQISDPLLLDARELKRQAAPDAQQHRRYASRPGGLLAYFLRTQDGSVGWSDVSRPLPSYYYRLALLARQLAKGVCGFSR